MKRKLMCCLLAAAVVMSTFLNGCSSAPKRDPEEAVKKAVMNALEREPEDFSELLESGIIETEKSYGYILAFPEELKEPYLNFLSDAYASVEFQISTIDEREDGYLVRVSYEPLDIGKSLEDVNAGYIESMTETDLVKSVSALLEEDKKALEDTKVCLDSRVLDFTVEEKDGVCTVSEEAVKNAMSRAAEGYMKPYEDVCTVLDLRDFFQSYLDATFKGEFTQFTKHTGKTPEEARDWSESGGAFDPPADLSESYGERCSAAYRNILKQCRYTVGIPKQSDQIMDFTVDVTISPNNSLTAAWNEFKNGTYYDLESASAAYVASLEKYALAPVFGDETTISAEVNSAAFVNDDETSDVYRLVEAICPIPD